MNQQTGTGTTTRAAIRKIRETMTSQYVDELKAIGLKGAKLKDLSAGFLDGMTNMLRALVAEDVIMVEEDAPAEHPEMSEL